MRAHRLGASGERAVARWYWLRGYSVRDRNWRHADGELDLVVQRGDRIVFCEVKTRTSTRFGSPVEAVDEAKFARIQRLSLAWLADHSAHRGTIRYDIASVTARRIEVVSWE